MTEHTDDLHSGIFLAPGQVPGQLELADAHALADADAELRRELDRLTALKAEHTVRALARVVGAAEAAAATAAELDRAVIEARGRGATWQQIGDAVGMTRQSAWKRWATPTDHPHDTLGAGGRCTYCGGPA